MKIAIIDDEQDMRQSISQWLSLSGFDTETYASAEDALKAIGTDFPGVVVTDVKMPGMDGMAFLKRLMGVDSGIPVLNQAVLLRRVNDDADTLTELCEKLIDVAAMPYYLHQLDRVRGAAHFEVPVERGIALMEDLRRRLPGYAVPKFVIEQAGQDSKTPLVMQN